jgi:hypothetical protein
VIREDGTVCQPGEQRPDRHRAARPGDVPRLLEAPDATREKFIGDWMTTGDQGVSTTTAISASSAATTMSSPRRAIASARAKSRIA